MFDELSSYAFVTQDRTCRFGVSVYLSTEILQSIPAGTDVIVTAKAKKIGRTLGFATMEMHDLEGSLLARGDHIKHLPMGFMWDFLAQFMQSRFVLPIILKHGESLNKMKVRIKNYHSLSFKKKFFDLKNIWQFEFDHECTKKKKNLSK